MRVIATLVLAIGIGLPLASPVRAALSFQDRVAPAAATLPRPIQRSTIEAVDVELDVEFTDEQLVYHHMRTMLDRDFETLHHEKFRANRSLRDVEPEVNLFLKDLTGRDVSDET